MKKVLYFILFVSWSFNLYSQSNCGEPYSGWHRRLTPNTTYKWWIEADVHSANFYSAHNVPITSDTEKNNICWAAAQHAATQWDNLLNGININFTKADYRNEADILIHFYHYADDVTSGTAPVNGNDIDINLYPGFKLTDNTSLLDIPNADYRDIYAIVTHEWGHVLLDGGHTNQEIESVMYKNPRNRYFTDCDRERILSVLDPFKIITVKNSFGQGLMKIDNGSFITISASGKTINDWRESTFPHSFTAKAGQYNSSGFLQKFQNWTENISNDVVNALQKNLTIALSAIHTANFLSEFNITFKNQHSGGEVGGSIKVDNESVNSPSTLPKLNTIPIRGEAINHTLNHIYYTFNHWSEEGGTQNPYNNFLPPSHKTYSAIFKGKPTNGFRNQTFNTKVVG